MQQTTEDMLESESKIILGVTWPDQWTITTYQKHTRFDEEYKIFPWHSWSPIPKHCTIRPYSGTPLPSCRGNSRLGRIRRSLEFRFAWADTYFLIIGQMVSTLSWLIQFLTLIRVDSLNIGSIRTNPRKHIASWKWELVDVGQWTFANIYSIDKSRFGFIPDTSCGRIKTRSAHRILPESVQLLD